MPEMWFSLGMLDGYQWAHSGCNLSYSVLIHSEGLWSLSVHDTGSNRHRVASYPTNLQTTKAYQLKVPKITLSTCTVEQIKNTSQSGYNSTPQEALKVAELEGLWLPRWTNWGNKPKEPNKKTERNESWVPCMLTFIPTLDLHKKDISDVIKWCHCHLLLHLGGKSLCIHAQ